MSYSPYIEPKKSQFGELRVSEPTQQINLKSNYGISALRDIVTTTGGGSVTTDMVEYRIFTGATGTDTASLETAERGRYLSNQDAEAGIEVRVPTLPTGSQIARWGYFDTDNGFGFGVDATGIFLFDRDGGSETVVRPADWNADKLDGTGSSGYTINLADGHIFQIVFSYYGVGTIEFKVITTDATSRMQKVTTVHRIRKEGQVSIANPNLPVSAEARNGGTATAFPGLYVCGRQFSTIGKFTPARRVTSARRLAMAGVGATAVPVISLRRKAAFESVSVKCQGFDIMTDQPVLIEVRTGGALTGASYATPASTTAAETAVEQDVTATAIAGGELIWSGLLNASGSGSNTSGSAQIRLSDQDFIGLTPVSICALKIGATDATVSCVFRIIEEW